MVTLEQSVRQYLAWTEIEAQKTTLNLDAFQSKQAESKRAQANEAVAHQISDAYTWLLVPSEPLKREGLPHIDWQQIRLQGADPLPIRAAKRLVADELLLLALGGGRLRMELDRVPLWENQRDVSLRKLWEDFPRYLYLPRLKDSEVLSAAVRDGVGKMMWESDSFAIAERWDEGQGRYVGLRGGEVGVGFIDGSTLLVEPSVARAQLTVEAVKAAPVRGDEDGKGVPLVLREPGAALVEPEPAHQQKRRFHGSVQLNELLVASSADRIGEEVIRHLTGLVNARVRVTLEIDAEIPGGAPDDVVRNVLENTAVLKFISAGFEEE